MQENVFFFLAFPWLDFQFWLIAPPFGFISSQGLQQISFTVVIYPCYGDPE
jgi:hypothetical protein